MESSNDEMDLERIHKKTKLRIFQITKNFLEASESIKPALIYFLLLI